MLDFKTLNELTDLKELYEHTTGMKLRKHSTHWEGACPFCGGDDRFYIDPTKSPQLWTCTHCQGGKMHTALDYVSLCYGLPNSGAGLKETADKLRELLNISESTAEYKTVNTQHTIKKQETPTAPIMPDVPDADWQTAVKTAVNKAHEYLLSEAGKPYYNYFISRGFTDKIIRWYKLGFNPQRYTLDVTYDGEPVECYKGYYIPTFGKQYDDEPDTLYRVKVRTNNPKQKYIFIRGSKAKTLFCAKYALKYPNIIYVEGELDAISINQCAYDICHAVTFGSNGYIGQAEQWQSWYRMPDNTVICFDNDPDPDTMHTVRENEKRLQQEIIKAQSLDPVDNRGNSPVICHLPDCYHDWNDILKLPNGREIIRQILTYFFGGDNGQSLTV